MSYRATFNATIHYGHMLQVFESHTNTFTPTSHINPNKPQYNPFNVGTRWISLDNFNILSSDPEAHRIFPKLPLVSYQHERNLSDISSYTLLMPHHLPLMLVNCPANGFFARRAST